MTFRSSVILAVLLALCVPQTLVAQSDNLTFESVTVGSTAIGLTSTTYRPNGRGQMQTCGARLETAPVRYRLDGTDPTATEGVLLEVGETLPLYGNVDMARARFIRVTGTSGVLKVECWADAREIPNRVGTVFSRSDHPNRFHCIVAVSTATTLQAVGGSCAAPGATLSLYITDVMFAASAAGIAADAFPTLKSGTGGTCGTATAVIWQALTAAAIVAVDNRTVPIKVAANNELCWISSTAGSKTLQISGFIAP